MGVIYWGDMVDIYGGFMWGSNGGHMGVIWESYGSHMGVIWRVSYGEVLAGNNASSRCCHFFGFETAVIVVSC